MVFFRRRTIGAGRAHGRGKIPFLSSRGGPGKSVPNFRPRARPLPSLFSGSPFRLPIPALRQASTLRGQPVNQALEAVRQWRKIPLKGMILAVLVTKYQNDVGRMVRQIP